MAELKPVSFATVVAFWTLVTCPIKLIRIFLKWKYIQGKNYAILAVMLRVGVLIWVNFHPGYRDLVRKNRDLGNRARPASHMNTSKFFYEGKSGEARSRKPSQPV